MLFSWCLWALLGVSLGCPLSPAGRVGPKSPGDNFYRVVINGDVERYAPGQRYVVTLVGSRTHDVVQQFTRFKLSLEPLDPGTVRSPAKQGEFHLFADTLTTFDEECTNTVVEADDLPKTEVLVMWKAPPTGSGCVLIKGMVHENSSRWFAEDGQLTRRVCEDTSVSAPDCCACDDAKYKMVFEGLWSPATHPRNFPTEVMWLTHFSDVIGATHPKNFSFWGEGEIASDGFRMLAEWGSVGPMESELRQHGRLLRSVVKAPGLWHPRVNTNTTATFTVDRERHLLSLASMFGPSPDWVVGVSGLELCRADCSWRDSATIDLLPYDAGTDSGISYLSPNIETVPRERMYRITPMYPEDPRAPFYDPSASTIPPLARLYITREKIIPRGCDEESLQAMVTDEKEETKSADRPECQVSEWSSWTACSVSCGKGLRMRTREYRAPQKAAMLACDRQLVSKEMCVADIAECQPSNQPLEPSDTQDSAECRTTEWGPWGECSATCGVGVATRRRTFIDHRGLKNCPSVAVEENRKCMEPQCTEQQEPEISDPTCPTTEWSSWSPCSASCGRGVQLRTRLLLVPAARQLHCSARVELVQQRHCSETADCTVDMATAKQICMLSADAGPCRGVYRRWSFVAMKGMCVPFQYGGCRGNRNNFLTQQDCLDTCSRITGGGNPATSPAANSVIPALSQPTLAQTDTAVGAEEAAVAVDCQTSAWSDWSRCSVSCGRGYQERSRTVLVPAGPGGAPCPKQMWRRRRCERHC